VGSFNVSLIQFPILFNPIPPLTLIRRMAKP
jgi:hypothetical protein